MGRNRVKEYLDVAIKTTEVTRIKKGYKVTKKVKGQWLSLFIDGKDRKKEREIIKLKEKIKKLEGKKK